MNAAARALKIRSGEGATVAVVTALLTVLGLANIDPSRSRELLRPAVDDVAPEVRATAIAVLG